MRNEAGSIAVGCGFILAGLLWARGGLRRRDAYSLAEDFRATFLRLRPRYSGDLLEGGPRLIAPAMVVVAGVAIIAVVLVRRLWP